MSSIPIPSPQKPIQLYLWPQCGFCAKQVKVLSSLDAEMTNWFNRNVSVKNVENPAEYPMLKGYPHWVVSGSSSPGLKSVGDIVAMRRFAP